MRTFVIGLAVLSLTTTAALTQEPAKTSVPKPQFLAAMPANAATVANWHKQSVYDPSDNKVGEIRDVLVEKKDGKIVAFIIGVGGVLGAGEKDVAVPFNGVYTTAKGNDLRLAINATKDDLKNAPGYKYDRASTTWVPDRQ